MTNGLLAGTPADQPSIDVLPLFKQLDVPPPLKQALSRVFRQLGADEESAASATVLDAVLPLLVEDPIDCPPHVLHRWRYWRELFQRLAQCPREHLLHESGRKGVGFAVAKDYWVTAALIAQPPSAYASQVSLLKQLLLLPLLLAPSAAAADAVRDDVRTAADELRRSVALGDRREQLSRFPAAPFSLASVYAVEAAARAVPRGADPTVQGFLRAMRRLAAGARELLLGGATERVYEATFEEAFESDSVPSRLTVTVGGAEPDEPELAVSVPLSEIPDGMNSGIGRRVVQARSALWLYSARQTYLYSAGGPNPQQRARLASLLADLPARVQHGRLELSVALVTALMAATGLEVDRLLGLTVGPTGVLQQGRFYRRHFPSIPGAFMPPPEHLDAFAADADFVDLPLPNSVVALLQHLAGPQDGVRSLRELLALRDEHELVALSSAVGGLVREALGELTDYRLLKVAVRRMLREATGDDLAAWLLTAEPHQAPPLLLYYTAMRVDELVAVYRRGVAYLFGEDAPPGNGSSVGEVWVGSRMVPAPGRFRASVQALRDRVEAALRTADTTRLGNNIVAAHNLFASYVSLCLMAATGHRPVDDPFCHPDSLSPNQAIALIEDKVVSERHRFRCTVLPSHAIRQIECWRRHLAILAERGMRLGWPLSLLDWLKAQARESPAVAPLLFFLTQDAHPNTASVTPGRLRDQLLDWPWPLNAGRHLLATHLRAQGVPSERVRAQLGHLLPGESYFGAFSVDSPAALTKALSQTLDTMLADQGWELVSGLPGRVTSTGSGSHAEQHKHQDLPLGPDRRRQRREDQRLRDEALLNAVIGAVAEDATEPTLEELRDAVLPQLRQALQGQDERLERVYRLLRQRVGEADGALPQLRRAIVLGPGESPFRAEWPRDIRQFECLRRRFAQALGEQAARNTPSKAQRVAEIVLSAALFGGVASVHQLRAIGEEVTRGISTLDGILLVEQVGWRENRPPWRWLPDAVSAALILGYQRVYGEQSRPRGRDVERALDKLMSLGGAEARSASTAPYTRLAALAQSYWLYWGAGFARSFVHLNAGTRCLSHAALARLLTGARWALPAPSTTEASGSERVDTSALPEIALRHAGVDAPKAPVHDFTKQLYRWLREAKRVFPKRGELVKTARNRYLRQRLREEFAGDYNHPAAAVVLANWVLLLTRQEQRKKGARALGTVERYMRTVAKPLMSCAPSDFLELPAAEYEALYEEVLEFRSGAERRYLARLLRRLHRFMVDRWGVDEPDWGFLPTGASGPNAAAQLLTPTEYEVALRLLSEDPEVDSGTRLLQSALLFLGYRCGLRAGEAVGLQYRDLEMGLDGTLVVQVRSNRYRDTKSRAGRRQVPVLEKLDELEQRVLADLLEHGQAVAAEDAQGALLARVEAPRDPPDRTALVGRVQQALRVVSGEPRLRYHDLRHTYANRMFAALFGDVGQSPHWQRVVAALRHGADEPPRLRERLTGRRELNDGVVRALAGLMGHASPFTTLTYYVHTLDVYAHTTVGVVDRVRLSAQGWAYALLERRETVAKRLSRMQAKAGFEPPLAAGWTALVPQPDCPPAAVGAPALPALKLPDQTLTLTMVDRALLYAAHGRINPNKLAARLLLPPAQVEAVLRTARTLEAITGYSTIAPAEGPADSALDSAAVRETARVRSVLDAWQQRIARLDEAGRGKVQRALEAWQHAHNPASSWLIFGDVDEVREFADGLALLDVLPVHFDVRVDARSDGHESVAGRLPFAEFIERRLPRARYPVAVQQQRCRVGVLLNGQHPLFRQRGLSRALFVLSIWFDLQSSADPGALTARS